MFLLLCLQLGAQVISKPTLGFSKACASEAFNTFTFTFTSAYNYKPDNKFIVELSDSSGNFTTPVVLKEIIGTIAPVAAVSFSFPSDVYGSGYTIRVRSTNPAVVGASSSSFSAYYASFNKFFKINNYIPTINLCAGSSYDLTIDSGVDSPLNLSQLKYRWYKNSAVISGSTAPSLAINEVGEYYAEVDYGVCIYDSYSNKVNVNKVDIGKPEIQLNDPSSDLICLGTTKSMSCSFSDAAFSYQWFRDGQMIEGANQLNYEALTPGSYKLLVNGDGCSVYSNELVLKGVDFSAEIDKPFSAILIPGKTITLNASTDASSPKYTWYRNGVVIDAATNSSLEVSKDGTYKLLVRQEGVCPSEKVSEIVILHPFDYNIVIKADDNYVENQSENAILDVDMFEVLSNSNPPLPPITDNNYVYQWYKDGVEISGATSQDLNVSGSASNGVYKLGVTIPGYGEKFSNEIVLNFKISADVTISADKALCKQGDSVILTSKLSDLNYTYDWYYNGVLLSSGISNSIEITQGGTYFLIVKNGVSTIKSNSLILKEDNFNLEVASSSSVLFPGQQKVSLIAATDAVQPLYTWYKDGVQLTASTTSSLEITTPGTYKTVVKQSVGCDLEKEHEITIGYPTSISIEIATEGSYEECESASTKLKMSKIIADSPKGKVSLDFNLYNYPLQWLKNGLEIPGAVNAELLIADNSQNDIYSLRATIPNYSKPESNAILVKLGFGNSFEIEKTGVLCNLDSDVILESNYSDSKFNFEWIEESSDSVLMNANMIVVSEPGTYFLKVSYNGCSLVSEKVNVSLFDFSSIEVNQPSEFSIVKGASKEIIASGADEYYWYSDGKLMGQENSLKVTQEGNYTLVAKKGGCEKEFLFTVSFYENKSVTSNTVTPNGDGLNDFWGIPTDYAYREEVKVSIYDSVGNVVLNTYNYQNNWPENSFVYSNKSPLFYYIIEDAAGILKKGSITIIK